VGVAAASAVLYYNPLTSGAAEELNLTDRVLRYSLPDQVLDFEFGEKAEWFGYSAGENGLWEETIDRTAMLGLTLTDAANRPIGIASRLISVSPDSDLLLRGLLVSDYWLVTLPREGTLFVRADSNVWPFVKQTLVPVWYLERPWSGPVEYRPTVGPGARHTAAVLGLTGSFAGRDGSAVERYRVTALDPTSRSAAAEGELYLNLGAQQASVQ
jgi:hypothetical protein